MNVVSKTIMTGFLMLIPAFSMAETSISCAVNQGVLKSVSIGVKLNENDHSDYVTLTDNKVGQGSFSSSKVTYLEDDSRRGLLISLSNKVTGVQMDVFSEDLIKTIPGMYTGEARITVGDVQSSNDQVTYCTIIVTKNMLLN